jgi:transposase
MRSSPHCTRQASNWTCRRSQSLSTSGRQLGLEDLEQAVARNQAETEKRGLALQVERATKRRADRGALPLHLPRVEITLSPEDTACPCCRGVMTVIGQDTSEPLDVVPVQYRVVVTHRPELACRACEGTIVQSPAPPRQIEGGIPTEALVISLDF